MPQGGGGHPSQPPAGTPLAAAQQLKAEGNRLHTARQYGAAAEKYEQARQRIQGEAPGALELGPGYSLIMHHTEKSANSALETECRSSQPTFPATHAR